MQQQQFIASDSIPQQQLHENHHETTKLCALPFCEHATITAITITGMMILLVGISTLLIACCVSSRRKKEESSERSRPDAVISKSYRPSGEWIGYGARMKLNSAGGARRPRMESKPLRNLSAESDVSRSMIGTNTNTISDDICNSSRS
uniref:Uncharacterized protein n=1 Tax=Panagrolaimus sp. ES5 TaxID=591445 RepID=A0AC34FN89_9BILA